MAELFGLDAPTDFFDFKVVRLANGVSLDFMEKTGEIAPQHYAFLVSEHEFDAVLGRIQAKGLDYGRTRRARSRARSTGISAGAGSTSPTPTGTCWRRSPSRMAGRTRHERRCEEALYSALVRRLLL